MVVIQRGEWRRLWGSFRPAAPGERRGRPGTLLFRYISPARLWLTKCVIQVVEAIHRGVSLMDSTQRQIVEGEMVRFDAEHGAVHYPPDRCFRIWIRPSILIGTGIAILSLIVVAVAGNAWCSGCSADISKQLRWAIWFSCLGALLHFFNFFFVTTLIRSGLSILMDHPRLQLMTVARRRYWRYKSRLGDFLERSRSSCRFGRVSSRRGPWGLLRSKRDPACSKGLHLYNIKGPHEHYEH